MQFDFVPIFDFEFAFLSNYARILPESPVTEKHLYQAAQAACPEDSARIMTAEAPGDAKKMARKIPTHKTIDHSTFFFFLKNRFIFNHHPHRRSFLFTS